MTLSQREGYVQKKSLKNKITRGKNKMVKGVDDLTLQHSLQKMHCQKVSGKT